MDLPGAPTGPFPYVRPPIPGQGGTVESGFGVFRADGTPKQAACALSRDYGARLIVLHVASMPTMAYGEGFIPPDPPDIQHLAVRAAIHHYILCCQVILVNCATRAGKK